MAPVRTSVLAILVAPSLALADHPDTLPFEISTSEFDYNVFFDASNPYNCSRDEDGVPIVPPGADGNYMPIWQAQNVANALDRPGNPVPGFPDGYHPGLIALGFLEPDFDGEDDEVLIYDCAPGDDNPHEDDDCDNGRATASRIIMPSTVYCSSSERNIRRVTGHELFHHVSIAYTRKGAWGKVAWEGTARMMEDEVYDDIDGDETLSFDNESDVYLANPNQDLWRSSYRSALAWKHLSEQYGTVTTEPQVGVDFIRRIWENIQANDDSPDLPATMEQTIQEFAPGKKLHDWFHDFAIINATKEFDVSALDDPSKYDYIDENDGNGIGFNPVAREWRGSIYEAEPAVSAVSRWGAVYFEIEDACIAGWFMGYRVRNADDARHALLAIDGGGRVARLFRGAGEEFAVSFLQSGTQFYEQLVAIVIGRDDDIAFTYEFDCGPGTIDIHRPTSTYQAFVGPPDEPRSLTLQLDVTGPSGLGGTSVEGLQPEDFTVYIGTLDEPADEATVLNGADVLGQYWLNVRPPEKMDENVYDLHVKMHGGLLPITATSALAVSYEEKLFDQVLVIDRSGSMSDPENSPKLAAAQNAARLFVDTGIPDDQIGLVSFSDDATLDATLGSATDSKKQSVKTAVDALVANGGTSIGDGLNLAAAELFISGSSAGEDWVVLLSDGMESSPLFWDAVEQDIKLSGIRINTIALGDDADQVLMQEIAVETGGQYYFVDSDTFRGAGASVANALADAYAASLDEMRGLQRLWEISGNNLASPKSFPIEVAGDGIVDARFLFNWDDAGEPLGVEIVRPDGTPVADGVDGAEVFTDPTHLVVQIDTLTAGEWTVNIGPDSGTPTYVGFLSGRDVQGAELDVVFGQDDDDVFAGIVGGVYLRGLPQPVVATLIDRDGVIAGAEVFAAVEHPDGTVIDLRLVDDGLHDDGGAGDGVYAADYTRTTEFSLTDMADTPGTGRRGSYNVAVTAQGRDNFGNSFERIRKASFQVIELDGIKPPAPPSDTDEDGMPDRYEDLHDCIDALVDDGQADADDNGLTNRDEYGRGWNPCHPDTDRGGETDVSEDARGANPFDPDDDALPRPIDVEIVDYISEHLDFPGPEDLQPNSLLIRYPANPAYDRIRLLRKSGFFFDFTEVANFDAQAFGGLYRDEGLTNGVQYSYRVQPIDINGNEGTPSHIVSGVPRAEPVPPIGSVVINYGQPATTSTSVKLLLTASEDTVEAKISNTPDMDAVPWTPFGDQIVPWTLQPDPQTGVATGNALNSDAAGNVSRTMQPDPESGVATVYALYRDAAGNVSPTLYSDRIAVIDPGSVGSLVGTALLGSPARGESTPAEGITLAPLGSGDVTPEFTADDGTYTIRYLEPGTYDLQASYPNYEDETVLNVEVLAGHTVQVRTIVLGATDSDGDGVADIADNCTEAANASQTDTDLDRIGNACDLDLNNDCIVNFLDLGEFSDVFFTADAEADTNDDGIVNFLDVLVMEDQFFAAPGPSGIANLCD